MMTDAEYRDWVIASYGATRPIVERIADFLAKNGPTKRSLVRARVCNGDLPSDVVERAFSELVRQGRAESWKERYTGGGPRTIWALR